MSFEERNGKKWEVLDGTASEYEMGDVLFGLIRMLKPNLVVETGTYRAFTTRNLADAVALNGFGRVVSCDLFDYNRVPFHFKAIVDFRLCNSLDLPELKEADFVFSDSHENVRRQEYALVKPGCVFVMHDTDQPYEQIFPPYLGQFVRDNGGLLFHAGRGFGILIKP